MHDIANALFKKKIEHFKKFCFSNQYHESKYIITNFDKLRLSAFNKDYTILEFEILSSKRVL